MPLPEVTRRLVHAILHYQHDRLQDDATILLAQWLRPAPPGPGSTPPAQDPFDV